MEKVDLEFTSDGLEEMARRACDMNERTRISARAGCTQSWSACSRTLTSRRASTPAKS